MRKKLYTQAERHCAHREDRAIIWPHKLVRMEIPNKLVRMEIPKRCRYYEQIAIKNAILTRSAYYGLKLNRNYALGNYDPNE